MQKKEEIQAELNTVIQEIGKARANGDTSTLLQFRTKRNELEQELSELEAEQSYVAMKDAEKAKSEREAVIKRTLAEYDTAEKQYATAQQKITETLESLASLEDVLKIRAENLSGLNPLRTLEPIWKELDAEQQKELQDRFTESYGRRLLREPDFGKIFDGLKFQREKMLYGAARLKSKPVTQGPKFVGGKSSTRLALDSEIPSESPIKQHDIPTINRNKLLHPEKRRVNMR